MQNRRGRGWRYWFGPPGCPHHPQFNAHSCVACESLSELDAIANALDAATSAAGRGKDGSAAV
jgi:hypothetical protein